MWIYSLITAIDTQYEAVTIKGIGYENNKYLKIAIQEIKWAR